MRSKELELRKRATAVRLLPFRGGMCDLDFAQLVNDVVRVRDKSEGRDGGVANPSTAIAREPGTS